jgi:predicted metal-binding membrane protein
VTALEALLRRERVLVASGLIVLALLAWYYIWQGAGMGMSALDMTVLTLFPHAHVEPMQGMALPETTWLTVIAMWWVMMIAMMTPSAAPLVLLYVRVLRHWSGENASVGVSSVLVVTGYLAVWLAFSIVAAGLQYALERAGLISAMMLWSKSAWLSSLVLIGAGVYQLSPWKRACLEHCRGPVVFLGRRARTGRLNALRLGIEHGAWCVGCCWLLMALLFVGGVMNLVWVALLALLILAEKVVPNGRRVSALAGVVLIVWGLATLVHSGTPHIVQRADANSWLTPHFASYSAFPKSVGTTPKNHGGRRYEQPVARALPLEGRGQLRTRRIADIRFGFGARPLGPRGACG